MDRRHFLSSTGALGLTAAIPFATATPGLPERLPLPSPISREERSGRIARAQGLMRQSGLRALIVEAGSSLVYFTGVRWWRSERFTGVVIPADGLPVVVTPYFEEPSIRESLGIEADVRTWNEDESPFAVVAGVLADNGFRDGQVGIEETVRFFIADGVRASAPRFDVVPGAAITRGCRLYKSPAELALMQAANDITIAAYRHTYERIETGMPASDISALMSDITRQLGGEPTFSMALVNEASAYPHGTSTPQSVREGSVILMDCGCSVHDYQSDISRTWVHGEATKKQREVWATVKRGQELALETARPGTPAGKVDDVVRAYYESLGYGPGYRTPGLPHRLGHGIGMDGHEPVNFVHGEPTPLAAGMCLSNEPGLYIYGEFGVRLEDCLYMSEDGPQLFTALSPSIDRPFA